MFTLARPCPRCSMRFVPWRIWAITRWSCISCPACGARLNRRIDWQFAVLLIVGLTLVQLGVLTLVVWTSWPVWVPSLAVFLVAFWLLDMLTVRLVVAGEKRGILGYKV
jgi:hypothetical protein